MSLKRIFLLKEALDTGDYDPAKLDVLARRLAAIIYDFQNSDDRGDYAMSEVIDACEEAGIQPVPPDNMGEV